MSSLSFNSVQEDMQPDVEIYKVDADNETLNGAGVNMLGYEGVVFFAFAGKGEAGSFSLKAQQDTASNFGSAADLAGTAVAFTTAAGTNGFGFVEVRNPAEQYVRAVVTVPDLTTARPVVVIALRYGKNLRPETNADGELHVIPAEGTA